MATRSTCVETGCVMNKLFIPLTIFIAIVAFLFGFA